MCDHMNPPLGVQRGDEPTGNLIEQLERQMRTAAEERLILAAIAHVKALGLTGGTLTEAVAKVLEERREG